MSRWCHAATRRVPPAVLTVHIEPEDLEQVKGRQERLKAAMKAYHAPHPAELPVRVLWAHRAIRLGGGV